MFDIPVRERLFYYGEKMINIESSPVLDDEHKSLPVLKQYMLSVMQRHNGIGLAAPQVGIFRQYFVMKTDEGNVVDMVNPEVIQLYGREREGFEACLSIPPVGNGCAVPRCEHIRLEFSTSEEPETRIIKRLSGMDAIVAQHELDHLTGTFFIDRVNADRKIRTEVVKMFEQWRRKTYARA
jgi:peptide deformylase